MMSHTKQEEERLPKAESSKESTLAKSSKESTTAKSSKESIPAKSSKESTPAESSKESTPAKSSKESTPAKSDADAGYATGTPEVFHCGNCNHEITADEPFHIIISSNTDILESDSSEDELERKPSHIRTIAGSKSRVHRDGRTRSLYGASPSVRFGPKASVMKNQASILTIQDPGSQRLTWNKPPFTVLVIKKIYDGAVIQPFKDLVTWLVEVRHMVVFVEQSVLNDPLLETDQEFCSITKKLCTFKEGVDDLTDKIDFIVCLGGDGTLLYASSLFQSNVPPVMAFFMGSLGFLTPFDFTYFQEKITQIMEGNASLILRTRLKCMVCEKDSACSRLPSIKHIESRCQQLVLNEVVVDRGPCGYLCNLDLFVEGRYVTSVQGDGLIISTPTGSTAYSAAAGASMLHPNVPAILITPVCPHSLSFRPIVLPAGVEIKVVLSPNARNTAWVSFDGRNRQELTGKHILRITTSVFPVPSICSEDQIEDWFKSLGSCLHWNVRRPQQAFSATPSMDSIENSDYSSNNGQDSHS